VDPALTPAFADGSIVISPPLWIDGGAIRRARVLIAGTPVTLIFPTSPAVPKGARLVQLEEPRFRGRPIPQVKFPPRNGWGNFDVEFNRLLVRALRFVTPMSPVIAPTTSAVPREFYTQPLDWLRLAWPPWFEFVQDWICAWTGLIRELQDGEETRPFIDAAAERVGVEHPGTATVRIEIASHGPQPAASAEQLRAAFICATHAYRIPASIELLKQAQSAHLHGRYRQCVIDACTAAEASISERVQAELMRRSVPTDARERITRQAGGVVELSQLARSMGLSLPVSLKAISDRLAGPRNLAVHVGSPLDAKTATAAFPLARQLVNAVNPLPPASSILRRHWDVNVSRAV